MSTRNPGLRRALNVAVAFAAIVLTLPVWIAIAVAIKVGSRGPIFYSQLRVGVDARDTPALPRDPHRKHDLGGRPFLMHKFRTMVVDAERSTGPVWANGDDPRVTTIGRFLRRSRLDELPQLLNVLKGDMNVVGPRPERPAIFAELRVRVPRYAERQRVLPGITGHAQVHFEADSSIEDVARKLHYDLDYISRASFWTDLRIMALTLPVLVFRKAMLLPARNGNGPATTPVPGRAAQLAAIHVQQLTVAAGASDGGSGHALAGRTAREPVLVPAHATMSVAAAPVEHPFHA